MGSIEDCRTRWRLRRDEEEEPTTYRNDSSVRLRFGGWEQEYIDRCLVRRRYNQSLWLVSVDESYRELLAPVNVSNHYEETRVTIVVPKPVLNEMSTFRFDIKSCSERDCYDDSSAISSDEFYVQALSTAPRTLGSSSTEPLEPEEPPSGLSPGGRVGIGIGLGLAAIALGLMGFLYLYRRRRRRREIESYLLSAAAEETTVTAKATSEEATVAEMPASNSPEAHKRPIFEMEGQEQHKELQGSLPASEMPGSQPAPAELAGSPHI
ncbi:hypothetical protein MferCBS31731_003634 [Microsporum ferrugineum]